MNLKLNLKRYIILYCTTAFTYINVGSALLKGLEAVSEGSIWLMLIYWLCLLLFFRPLLHLHGAVQPRHSPLRATGESFFCSPSLFSALFFLHKLEQRTGRPAAPLQGSDHRAGCRESGHLGASRAVDGDGHHCTHQQPRPAWEGSRPGEALDPHCPVLVHRTWASWREQRPLAVVEDSVSREDTLDRWTSPRSSLSSSVPGGGEGGEGLDGRTAWHGRGRHHEANWAVAFFASPPPSLQRFFRASGSFTWRTKECPHFLFILLHPHLILDRLWYPQLQTQNQHTQKPMQAPLFPPVFRWTRLGPLLYRPARLQPSVLPGRLPEGAPLWLPFPQPCHNPDTHQWPGRRGRPSSVLRALQVHAHERAGRAKEEGGVQGAGRHGGRVLHVSLKTWRSTSKWFKYALHCGGGKRDLNRISDGTLFWASAWQLTTTSFMLEGGSCCCGFRVVSWSLLKQGGCWMWMRDLQTEESPYFPVCNDCTVNPLWLKALCRWIYCWWNYGSLKSRLGHPEWLLSQTSQKYNKCTNT